MAAELQVCLSLIRLALTEVLVPALCSRIANLVLVLLRGARPLEVEEVAAAEAA